MRKKFQILVAEDTDSKFILIEFDISKIFVSDANIARVKTLAELEQVFSERSNDFSFIVLDANLADGATLRLLTLKIKPNFNGPIIANSSSAKNRATQMKFGCTHAGGNNFSKTLTGIKAMLVGNWQ